MFKASELRISTGVENWKVSGQFSSNGQQSNVESEKKSPEEDSDLFQVIYHNVSESSWYASSGLNTVCGDNFVIVKNKYYEASSLLANDEKSKFSSVVERGYGFKDPLNMTSIPVALLQNKDEENLGNSNMQFMTSPVEKLVSNETDWVLSFFRGLGSLFAPNYRNRMSAFYKKKFEKKKKSEEEKALQITEENKKETEALFASITGIDQGNTNSTNNIDITDITGTTKNEENIVPSTKYLLNSATGLPYFRQLKEVTSFFARMGSWGVLIIFFVTLVFERYYIGYKVSQRKRVIGTNNNMDDDTISANNDKKHKHKIHVNSYKHKFKRKHDNEKYLPEIKDFTLFIPDNVLPKKLTEKSFSEKFELHANFEDEMDNIYFP